jgi:hypothetical protein
MTKNTTKTWRTNMKIEEKLYKDKCLKKRATEINYKMHEIKLGYYSLNSPNNEAWLWLYRRKLGLETHVKWLL